ncbi:MAG: hypothetical protein M3063_05315 [Actinomycetota bacterium]|nr:hypothetical protein [Actinomycetota bacterium]
MNKKQLREWVRAWADRYPASADEPLAAYAGRDSLDREAMAVMVKWKFNNMAHRKANATRYLAREPDGRIEDLTQRAFACNDDLGALLIVDVLSGVGPALGSSILMASDSGRYTVMDTRSLQSIRALDLLGPGRQDASEPEWLDYLRACRSLSDTAGESLRRVDRALFSADGKTGPP